MKSPAHPTRPKNRKKRSKSVDPPLHPRAAKGKKKETILDWGSAKTPGFLRGGFSPIHSSRVFLRGRMTGDSLAIWVLSAEGGVEGNLSHSSHFGFRQDGASLCVRRNKTPQFQGSKTLFGFFGYQCNFWNPLSESACSSCLNSDKIIFQRVGGGGSKRWVLWGGGRKAAFPSIVENRFYSALEMDNFLLPRCVKKTREGHFEIVDISIANGGSNVRDDNLTRVAQFR